LIGIEGQVVTDYGGSFLGGYLGHRSDVVEE
jgi:hypothetical protein